MNKWFFIVFLLTATIGNAAEYHFSSGGNDATGNGSIKAPWQSVKKMNAVLAISEPGDKILLKRGDMFFGTINVGASGVQGKPLVIGAYGTGKLPVVTGLINIIGWSAKGKSIFEKTLTPTPSGSLNMVLVNGKLQPVARFPKAGVGNDSYLYIKSHKNSTQITSDGISRLPDYTGAEIVQRKIQWIIDRALVTAHNANTLSLQPLLSPDHPTVTYENVDGHGFFFQNHINAVTSAGDWCYDKRSGKLSVLFEGGSQQRSQVEAAVLSNLLTISNKKFVRIENIHFRGANENIVQLDAVTNNEFTGCTFEFAGVNAIDVARSSIYTTHHNTVSNCTFLSNNNNALNLVETMHWNINNNLIRNTALHQGMGVSGDGQYVGIFKAGSNSVIEYNTVENTGYHGIWFAGDNTIVRYNYVHHFLLNKSDGGGIYAYGKTGINRQVFRNIIHDGVGDRFGLGEKEHPYSAQVHGIYMDGNTTGVTISENTCFNNNHSGIWLGSNGEITVTGNTLYNNKVAQLKGVDNERAYTRISISDNVLVAKEKGSLLLSFNVSPASMAAINIDKNFYSRPVWQPDRIRAAKGYSKVPFDWDSYHDGGTVETGEKFHSLDEWKKLTTKDVASRSMASPNGAVTIIRFEFNPTRQPMKVALKGDFNDDSGKVMKGEIVIPPYGSKLLFSPAFSPVAPGSLQLRKS